MRLELCLAAGISACSFTPQVFAAARLDETRDYLGTVVRATVCYGPEQRDGAALVLQEVWKSFADIHARMNAFEPGSDVSLLNAASGHEVKVHDDVYRLLEKSRDHVGMTRGVFDVTVKPLTALWKEAGRRGYIPTADEIGAAKKLVGADRIELLGHGRVRIPAGMKVDLGGNAAGFAADQAADIFRKAGFNDFLVDAGGEIFVGGQACEGRPWRVGIHDPEGRRRWTDVIELKDQAVSTSGNYQKYMEINGTRWPHIVNAVTGYPARGVVSASVIAPYALDADVLSTALCILGPGPGLALVDALGEGYAAMVMTENEAGKLVEKATRGYAVYRVN